MPESLSRVAEPDSPDRPELLLGRLSDELRRLERVIVAFSGGADSALVAKVATEVLGPERVLAVTAVSESLAVSELEDCRRQAAEWSLRWLEVRTRELDRSEYRANGADRCYHCKAELMSALLPLASVERAAVVLGVNLDDLGDHRPGQRAAVEGGAVFPLVLAGLTKADVRSVSKHLGLRTWDKPAAACLASRLPYGTTVTLERLTQVAKAEAALHRLGFSQLRVRHYGDLARIELDPEDLEPAVGRRDELVAALKAVGYTFVTLDLEGFRSGSLNQVLSGSTPLGSTGSEGAP